jgi:hypothetical protein
MAGMMKQSTVSREASIICSNQEEKVFYTVSDLTVSV